MSQHGCYMHTSMNGTKLVIKVCSNGFIRLTFTGPLAYGGQGRLGLANDLGSDLSHTVLVPQVLGLGVV